jgi:hypothetical protein
VLAPPAKLVQENLRQGANGTLQLVLIRFASPLRASEVCQEHVSLIILEAALTDRSHRLSGGGQRSRDTVSRAGHQNTPDRPGLRTGSPVIALDRGNSVHRRDVCLKACPETSRHHSPRSSNRSAALINVYPREALVCLLIHCASLPTGVEQPIAAIECQTVLRQNAGLTRNTRPRFGDGRLFLLLRFRSVQEASEPLSTPLFRYPIMFA